MPKLLLLLAVLLIAACGSADDQGDTDWNLCEGTPTCPSGYVQSNTDCTDDDWPCEEVTQCGETIFCQQADSCDAVPTCDTPYEEEVDSEADCPPDVECYQRSMCGMTIWCADIEVCDGPPPECGPPCDAHWDPVCGVDGNTYSNACYAEAEGVEIDHVGECQCTCPYEDNPVCGVDGETYENECHADCAGVDIADDETICSGDDDDYPKECICPDVYAPVCGEDDHTYGNECIATCAGVDIDHQGYCGP